MTRLLVVDDSALMRKLLGQIFEQEKDFIVEFARNGVEALAIIDNFQPDVVSLDVHMPLMNGLDCLDQIMLRFPRPVVMISSLTEAGADETFTALEMGAVDFITKPSGAISLHIDELASLLVEKIRNAAAVRVKRSRRLTERLRSTSPRTELGETAAVKNDHRSHGLVLVGTSTGGPPALDVLLSRLPARFPWPVIVAQHMPRTFTGPLARRLDKLCPLKVVEVLTPMIVERGTIYIAMGDADIVVTSRGAQTFVMPAPSDDKYHWHPSVERLVRSTMKHCSLESVVGVLMTGMGTDGAAAMSDLKAKGGHTIAESEESAVVWGMPGELVRLGGATDVLPVEKIGSRLLDLAS